MSKKRIVTLLLVLVMAVSLFAVCASADVTGEFGNATVTVKDSRPVTLADGEYLHHGWEVTVVNPGQTFTLWLPDSYYYNIDPGHIRYTPNEYGTGSCTESFTPVYYINDNNYGPQYYILGTPDELGGIYAKDGCKFDHYEITYWTGSYEKGFTEVDDEVFNPGDIVPFDANLVENYVVSSSWLEITVCYVPDASTLAGARLLAKEAIDEAVGDDTSDNVLAAADDAKQAIDIATTIEDVNDARDEGIAAIEAAKLANAKEAAKKAIDDAIAGETDPSVIKAADDAKKAIDDAKTMEDVEAAKEQGLKDVEKAIEAAKLAADKADAMDEIKAAAAKAVSDEAKAIAAGAEARLDAAKSADEIESIKDAILKEMADADKALADAKDSAIAQLQAAAGSNMSDAMKAILQDAINKVNAATSQSAVSTALSNGLSAINAQYAIDNPPEPQLGFFERLFQKIGVIVEKILSIFKF